jgi:hypothetical protein
MHDSRAERIKEDTAFVTSILPKMGHATVAKMLTSFCNAVDDPDDELVHLFEIAEAAKKAFCGEPAARSGLGLTKEEWDALARLSHKQTIRQGRHRGKETTGMRDATPDELEKARKTARKIMQSFAAKVQ